MVIGVVFFFWWCDSDESFVESAFASGFKVGDVEAGDILFHALVEGEAFVVGVSEVCVSAEVSGLWFVVALRGDFVEDICIAIVCIKDVFVEVPFVGFKCGVRAG